MEKPEIGTKVKLLKVRGSRYAAHDEKHGYDYAIVIKDDERSRVLVQSYINGNAVGGPHNVFYEQHDIFSCEIELYQAYEIEEIESNLDKLCLKLENI